MNNNYRFKFHPYRYGSKRQCPRCGRKGCLTTYIDLEGEYQFPDYVGRCDHENSCGYIYTPWDCLRDNPTMKKDFKPSSRTTHIVEPMKPKEPSFIPAETMCLTLCNYNSNPLYKFSCGLIGGTATEELFRLYNVGTSKRFGGSVIFWQVDKTGRVRTGKVMAYNPHHRPATASRMDSLALLGFIR